jgi:hypothetical protein
VHGGHELGALLDSWKTSGHTRHLGDGGHDG